MKKLVVAALALVSLFALAAPAAANHSWSTYHWARASNPFPVQVGDNVGVAWDAHLTEAAGDWGSGRYGYYGDGPQLLFGTYAGNPVQTAVFAGGIDPKKCRPTSGKVQVCAASYGRNGWLGLASIWASGSHITQATVKLNESYYRAGTKYDSRPWRLGVTCQEIGHAWGLGHQDESGADFHTCMDYANSPDEDNAHPNLHDFDQLKTIYGHADSGPSYAAATGTGSGLRKITDKTWVEDLGDGRRRFVFVVWHDEAVHGPPAGG